jgi:hypothetical protein
MCNFIKVDSTKCKSPPSKKFNNGFCARASHQPKEPVVVAKEEPIVAHVEEPIVEKPIAEEPISETESSDASDADDVSPIVNAAKLIDQARVYLRDNCDGSKYFIENRLKQFNSDAYMHEVKDAVVLRIEFSNEKRRFYWIYSNELVLKFNQFVGLAMKLECHDIIVSPRCKMFFDIDMKLDLMQLDALCSHYNVPYDDIRNERGITAYHRCIYDSAESVA